MLETIIFVLITAALVLCCYLFYALYSLQNRD